MTVDAARDVRFYMTGRFLGSIAGWEEWDGESWRKCRAVDSLMVSLGTSRERGRIETICRTNYAQILNGNRVPSMIKLVSIAVILDTNGQFKAGTGRGRPG